ncbi:M24 family metallopeptidase [Botrimarina hoheduenensis]|nr:Xaa-Pro peptidase family protein [Botrimarina hoheduenensis]
MLDTSLIVARQQRLLKEMDRVGAAWTILTRSESVQWLTGAYVGPLFSPCVAIEAGGKVTLVLPARKVSSPAVAAEVLPYEEKRLSTMRDACHQQHASLEQLFKACPMSGKCIGYEASAVGGGLVAAVAGPGALDFDDTLFSLRRRKDPDELALMARANEANRAMYEHARRRIQPGLNEIDLYSELQTIAVKTLGQPLTYFGQDFCCAARGGAPRDRVAAEGELWILDLGVGYGGYFTDNARTFAVGEPSALQVAAWERVTQVFPIVQDYVRPGASCRELFERINKELATFTGGVFNHHLGHGVGLAPHEAPRLNPNWDDHFEVGDYFTAEPGLYGEDLRLGLRLEQNYVVTETGVTLLTDWPLAL